jgi:hypothetical protein
VAAAQPGHNFNNGKPAGHCATQHRVTAVTTRAAPARRQRMRLTHMLLNSMLPMLTDTSPARALLSGQASTQNRVLTHRAKAQAQLRGAATHATWVAPQHCFHTDNHTQQTHHGLHRGLAHITSKPIYLPTYSACTLLCGELEANRPGQLQTAQYHSRKPAADDAVYYLYI